ncbi:MAG: V-type ATP synthase subunit F [Thermoplasmata archaeon]
MPESSTHAGRTAVVGERELAIGFRLIGLKDVFEVTDETATREFQRLMGSAEFSLLIASQTIRPKLSESQRAHADSSLRPLVVFVPTPGAAAETEGIEVLAKRVLGVSLAVPH